MHQSENYESITNKESRDGESVRHPAKTAEQSNVEDVERSTEISWLVRTARLSSAKARVKREKCRESNNGRSNGGTSHCRDNPSVVKKSANTPTKNYRISVDA